uniref:Uncharacterized protein n=1 Tax=viral metagenome TaxID=1070528 RepID=A0A6H2A0K2_9ZZZZ
MSDINANLGENTTNDVVVDGADSTEQTDKQVTTGENTGEAGQIPDGNKPSDAWMHYREKAKKADEYEKQLKEYEKQQKEWETAKNKLSKRLPNGIDSLEEYIASIEEDDYEEPEKPTYKKPVQKTEDVDKIVEQKLNSYFEKQQKKTEEDTFIVKNVEHAFKFLNVDEVPKIPQTALAKFFKLVDAGLRDINLVDIIKAEKYDSDLPKAKEEGTNKAKSQVMSVAHTNQVQGTNSKTEYDDINVPQEVREQLAKNGIKDRLKQNMYYKKYHR